MRWLAVVGLVLALVPVGAGAQSVNCITTYLGGMAFTNCYGAESSRLNDPPPGYRYRDSFTRKYVCRLNSIQDGRQCEPWTAEDFTFEPIPRPVPPPPPAPRPPPPLPPWLIGPCGFKLGFKALRDQIPDVVGECGENEHWNTTNGDSVQQTKKGLMVWRRADNFTAFTDGYRTWVAGPLGVQQRLNTECFAWETGCPGR